MWKPLTIAAGRGHQEMTDLSTRVASVARRLRAHVAAMCRALVRFVVANIREVIFLLGLLLLTTGLALVYVPLALIVSGLLLLWLAIPPRSSENKQ